MDSVLVQMKKSIEERWQELGLALGITKTVLNEFEQYTPDQCLNFVGPCDFLHLCISFAFLLAYASLAYHIM